MRSPFRAAGAGDNAQACSAVVDRRVRGALGTAAILGVLVGLAGCFGSSPPLPADTPPASSAGAATPTTPAPAASGSAEGTSPMAAAPRMLPPPPMVTAPPLPGARPPTEARWVATTWADLPGWSGDRLQAAWPALLRSCERPAAGWASTCQSARALGNVDDAQARQFLQQQLEPWRVEARDGRRDGLITGYYEPLLEASRLARGAFQVPLYRAPAELGQQRPWYSRSQIEQDRGVRQSLRGLEFAHLADPLDALVLQIQGSGRLWITEPDGRRHLIRAAFAGHNDHPYKSVGRWLVDRGAFTVEQASWPAIKAWARANPSRVPEMIAANPRYVFFREEPLPDPSVGPLGAQGVPLTPGRSIAVDRQAVPYGTPVWLDTTEPQVWSANPPPARPLQRLVMAQDTGSAIVGAVRADYFWGWGDGADDVAGRMKQPLRMWVLWPRASRSMLVAEPVAVPVPTPSPAQPGSTVQPSPAAPATSAATGAGPRTQAASRLAPSPRF